MLPVVPVSEIYTPFWPLAERTSPAPAGPADRVVAGAGVDGYAAGAVAQGRAEPLAVTPR